MVFSNMETPSSAVAVAKAIKKRVEKQSWQNLAPLALKSQLFHGRNSKQAQSMTCIVMGKETIDSRFKKPAPPPQES